MNNQEFLESLIAYCRKVQEDDQPIVPLIKNDDGTINREETLALPAYIDYAR